MVHLISSAPLFSLLLFLLLSSLSLISLCKGGGGSSSRSSASALTAYEVLEENGFPSTLLPPPPSVTGYDLNNDTGSFQLYLKGTCTVQIPDLYPVKYQSTITGTISYGKLASLKGISVKVILIWWRISSITVSGDELVFKVGPVSASFPIANFDENPGCEESRSLLQAS